jgi:hypothetical protein
MLGSARSSAIRSASVVRTRDPLGVVFAFAAAVEEGAASAFPVAAAAAAAAARTFDLYTHQSSAKPHAQGEKETHVGALQAILWLFQGPRLSVPPVPIFRPQYLHQIY